MSDCLVEKVETEVVVLAVDDTLPKPSVKLLHADDEPIDASGITSVTMHFSDIKPESLVEPLYTPVDFTVVGAQVGETAEYEFAIDAAETAAATEWQTKIVIVEAGGTYTLPTAPVKVVDYSELWGDPSVVAQMAPGHTNSEYIAAILSAEAAVRAWVTTTIASPVSERVAYAVALMASRALTTPPEGVNIVSETMGDYSVRYANTAPGGLYISDDIQELLGPWRPTALSVYIGPDDSELTYLTTTEVAVP